MTKFRSDGIEATATWQVVVRRHGAVVHQELVESPEQAATIAATWGDVEDAEVEVTDLQGHREGGDLVAFDDEEDYPHA